MSSNLKDTVLSFANLVATSVLPPTIGGIVTAALPIVADIVLGPDEVAAIVEGGSNVVTTIWTQTGQGFAVSIDPITTPVIFEALKSAHQRSQDRKAGSDPITRTQKFQGFSVSTESNGADASGGVSILNGVIGVQW
jgi:hypothetical protein